MQPSVLHPFFHRLVWSTIFLALALVTPPLSALPAPQRETAERRVYEAIAPRFTVMSVTGGVVLVPRSPIAGVDNIELRDGAISINGTMVTGAELRQRLGRDAAAVIELSYLDAESQQRLFPARGERARPAAPGTPAPPAPGASPSEGRQPEPREDVGESSRTFRRHTDGRVRVGGSVTVGEDERVDGAVVAVFGSVTVNGMVVDNVVAVGGDVHLGPRAVVRGDVTSVGGGLTREEGAVVTGQINEVDFRMPHIRVRPVEWWPVSVGPWWDSGLPRPVRFFGTLLRMTLFALLAALFLLLVPGAVGRIERTIRYEPWKSLLAGVFAQLLFVPLLVIAIVVLLVSIVGIPLLALVPFAILALLVALVLGFAGSALAFSRALLDRSGKVARGPFVLLAIGLAAIWGITLAGRVLGLPGGPIAWLAAMVLAVGFLVEYAAWTVGLGGALLTRLGSRERGWADRPPIPPVPPPTAVDDASV
ncbi:MAG: polymer-forming cytoskeletal protein [Acidobacteria bacterium]|nr:MAG: polymer-forming cytoskeletal protein [Acidobacteriota bacterium]